MSKNHFFSVPFNVPFNFFLFLACGLFLLFTSSSEAKANVQVTAQEAELIKTKIEAYYSDFKTKIEQGGGMQIVAEGDFSVEPAEGYYALTTPHFTLRPADPKDTLMVDIGMFAANMIPVSSPYDDIQNIYSISMALPTPMSAYENDQLIGQVKIKDQQSHFVWASDMNFLLKAGYSFSGMDILHLQDGVTLSLGDFTFDRAFKRNQDGTWQGQNKALGNNIELKKAGESETVTIDSFSYDMVLDSYALNAYDMAESSFMDLAEWTSENPSQIQLTSFLDVYKRLLQSYGDNESRFSMKNLRVNDNGEPKMSIAEITSFGMMDTDGEGRYEMGMKFSDIALLSGYDKLPAMAQEIFPINYSMNVAFSKFPTWEAIEQSAQKAEASLATDQPMDDRTAQIVARKSFVDVLERLKQAGFTMGVKEFSLDMASYGVSLTGEAQLSQDALMGGVGSFNMRLKGIDKLLERAKQIKAENPDKPQPEAEQILAFLPMVQMMGQIEQQSTPTQPSVRLYRFEIKPDGKILMNGTDLSMLQQQLGGGQRKPGVQKQGF